MSGGAVIAVIWVIVFVIGVAVGVVAIIALSAMRDDGKHQQEPDDPDDLLDDLWPERDHGASGIPGRWDGTRLSWPDAPTRPNEPGNELTA
jgi:hypothetical protein